MNGFEQIVKDFRRENSLTQIELAQIAGVGLRFVREVEQGKKSLRLDKVNQLLSVLELRVGPVTYFANSVMRSIAKRYVWWKEPQIALENKVHFLCQVMRYATWEDAISVLDVYGEKNFKYALINSPSGIFDDKSWKFWHLWLGVKLISALPARRL